MHPPRVCLVVVGVVLAIFSFRTIFDATDMGRFMAEAGNRLRPTDGCSALVVTRAKRGQKQ